MRVDGADSEGSGLTAECLKMHIHRRRKIFQVLVKGHPESGGQCGLRERVAEFLLQPITPPSTSCASEVPFSIFHPIYHLIL